MKLHICFSFEQLLDKLISCIATNQMNPTGPIATDPNYLSAPQSLGPPLPVPILDLFLKPHTTRSREDGKRKRELVITMQNVNQSPQMSAITKIYRKKNMLWWDQSTVRYRYLTTVQLRVLISRKCSFVVNVLWKDVLRSLHSGLGSTHSSQLAPHQLFQWSLDWRINGQHFPNPNSVPLMFPQGFVWGVCYV